MEKEHKVAHLVIHIILLFTAFLMILPFYWMVITSLKTNAETLLIPPTLLPKHWEFSNFVQVLKEFHFGRAYLNTFIVTLVRTGGQFFLCSTAAFAFATLRFRGKNVLFVLVLSVLMFPPEMFIIPVYKLMKTLHWFDTYFALTIPIISSAFGIFLLRQFFLSIPRELFEAARIDGCSYIGIYWKIYMPLSIPALVSLSIFVATGAWNDFLWPLIMTNSPDLQVLSIAISSFVGEYNTNYSLMMAGACVSVLPLIIMYLFLQKYFIEGIALSGIKY